MEFLRPNKHLYTFVKQQKSDSNEITSLKSNGITHTATVEKANILNTQFKSVFTKLIPLKLCHLIELYLPMSLPFPTMPVITISVNGVAKQLSKLNPGKAAGIFFWCSIQPLSQWDLGDFFSLFENKKSQSQKFFFFFFFFFRILIQSPHTHKLHVHGDNLLFSSNLMAIVCVIANFF